MPMTSHARAAALLAVVARGQAVTVRTLVDETGISMSAVYRHLEVLGHHGLVTRLPHGEFTAGPLALGLAEAYRSKVLNDSHVPEVLAWLSDRCGELSAYLVRDGNTALCVDSVEGTRVLRCCYTPGRSQPLHRGASALAILSQLSRDERVDVYRSVRAGRRDRAEAERIVDRVRTVGYATSLGAIDEGVWGISVPVPRGRQQASLSVMAPEARTQGRERELHGLLTEAAQRLSDGRITA